MTLQAHGSALRGEARRSSLFSFVYLWAVDAKPWVFLPETDRSCVAMEPKLCSYEPCSSGASTKQLVFGQASVTHSISLWSKDTGMSLHMGNPSICCSPQKLRFSCPSASIQSCSPQAHFAWSEWPKLRVSVLAKPANAFTAHSKHLMKTCTSTIWTQSCWMFRTNICPAAQTLYINEPLQPFSICNPFQCQMSKCKANTARSNLD